MVWHLHKDHFEESHASPLLLAIAQTLSTMYTAKENPLDFIVN